MTIPRARVLLAGLAGCALTTKAPPVEIRYFDPIVAGDDRGHARPDPAGIPLRLGRLTSAAHLRYRIVTRASPIEVRTYDTLRWTDYPEAYVRRAVAHALFDDQGFDQILGGPGPVLDLEVIAFEQGRATAGGDTGRVELRYQVHDERSVVAAGTVRVERSVPAPGIDGVVAAIGAALDAAAAELAQRLAAGLAPAR